MGTRVRVRPIPWSSPDAYPSGGNPLLSHRWAKWHSRLMAPIESRTPDWRMGFGLQTARTGLRYRNPVIERTATSRVSKSVRFGRFARFVQWVRSARMLVMQEDRKL